MQTLVSVWMTFGLLKCGRPDNSSLTLPDGSAPVQSHIPVHVSSTTHAEIARMFPYMQHSRNSTGSGAVPSLLWRPFKESESFVVPSCGNIQVIPLPVEHGRAGSGPYMCMGFRIKDFSYISDASRIPEETRDKLHGTRILVLDALREKPHPAHLSFDQVISVCLEGDASGQRIC